MKRINLTITAQSPLAIGTKKNDLITQTCDYIPGSVIRGAMAAKILQQAEAENFDLMQETEDDFKSLFLTENAAIFQNAYPTEPDQPVSVQVIPSTAVSSKAKPGFKPKNHDANTNEKPKNNGVFDTLIDRFCAECYGQLYDPNCPIDGGRVEPFSGFYTENPEKGYQKHSVTKRLLTRAGINRRRGTSEEQILYSIEVMNETHSESSDKNATYYSSIIIEDVQLVKSFKEFIEKHKFRLGGAVSRGLGKVEIKATVEDFKPDVASRIEIFNKTLQKRWKSWSIFGQANQPLDPKKTYFTLDLQSDAILTENWQRTMVISPEMLQQFTGISDPSLKLEIAYSSYNYHSGWNSAWGLMKDVELITNKGAVYLFSTEQRKAWEKALEKLEWQGVGERTAEGFGQVQICHPFHLVLREKTK